MFLGLRDIRFAKGRFTLMTGVVALVTFLLVMLSALTRGLGNQSTSAVTSLDAAHVLLAPSGSTTSWGDSVVSAPVASAAIGTADLHAQPLLVGHARAQAGSQINSVAVFGVPDAAAGMVRLAHPATDGHVVLARDSADDLHAQVGSTIELNGVRLVVQSIEPTRWYSHSPVAWTTMGDAMRLTHTTPGQATALLASGSDAAASDFARAHGLTALTPTSSVKALPGYSSEHGSLLMIQGFLYGICALVVMAFLSVWTIQRTRDIAVMRALGGSRGHVVRDALGQAALLLGIAMLIGGAVGTAAALLAQGRVPVAVVPMTTLVPTLGVGLLGLAGSWLATRRVATVDPLLALGGN